MTRLDGAMQPELSQSVSSKRSMPSRRDRAEGPNRFNRAFSNASARGTIAEYVCRPNGVSDKKSSRLSSGFWRRVSQRLVSNALTARLTLVLCMDE